MKKGKTKKEGETIRVLRRKGERSRTLPSVTVYTELEDFYVNPSSRSWFHSTHSMKSLRFTFPMVICISSISKLC